MADDISNDNKAQKFKFHKYILPHPDRNKSKIKISNEASNFCISFKFITNYLSKVDEKLSYSLQAILYDTEHCQFFGRIWAGPAESTGVKARIKTQLTYDQKLYLYTPHREFGISLVVELVVPNNPPRTLAWTLVPLQPEPKTRSARYNLYFGTPAVLLVDSSLAQEGKQPSEAKTGMELEVSQAPHAPLIGAHRLVPPYTLVGSGEVVPGLQGGSKDPLRNPRPAPAWDMVMEDVQLEVLPSLSELEQALVEYGERLEAGTIVERRLLVGIHNGWRYTQEESIFHLVAKSRALSSPGSPRRLCIPNKVILAGVPDVPGLALVFYLQYSLGSGVSRKSATLLNAAWGFWELKGALLKAERVTLTLSSDPRQNPSRTLLFRHPNIHFTLKLVASNKAQISPAVKETSIPANSKIHISKQVATLPLASEKKEQVEAFEEEMDLTEVQLTTGDGPQVPVEPLVLPPPSRLGMTTGAAKQHAMFLAHCGAKFPELVDWQGNLPTTLDHASPDMELELSAPPWRECVVLQLQAFTSRLEAAQLFHPKSLYFTFHFYRFPRTKTERLSLEPLPHNSPAGREVDFLLRPSESSNTAAGFTMTFDVNPADLKPNERKVFLSYLRTHWLFLQVWDGTTLIHIGTAAVELKYLLRQGRAAVEIPLQVELADTGRGVLHLRLANLARPLSPSQLVALQGRENAEEILDSQAPLHSKHGHTVSKPQLISSLASHLSPATPALKGLTESRRRKLLRMEAVRRAQETHAPVIQEGGRVAQRTHTHYTLRNYQQSQQRTEILGVLHRFLTHRTTLFPSPGTASLLQYRLVNPTGESQEVEVDCSAASPILSVLKDEAERNFLIGCHGTGDVPTPPLSPLWLPPHGSALVPFKVVLPAPSSDTPEWEAASGHCFSSHLLSQEPCPVMKVYFRKAGGQLLSVLEAELQPVPPRVERELWLRGPPGSLQSLWVRQAPHYKPLRAATSLNTTLASVKSDGPPYDVFLKAAVPSEVPKSSLVYLYGDPHMAWPLHIWRLTVEPQHRVDLTCPVGQTTTSLLPLRLRQEAGEPMQCHSSHPGEVEAHFKDGGVEVVLRPMQTGSQEVNLSVTAGSRKLLASILLQLTSPRPLLSRVFKVTMPLGRPATKHISYTNPYSQARRYRVWTSQPGLVQVARGSQILQLGPGESGTIALLFPPQLRPPTSPTEVLVGINNHQDHSEETFAILLTVQ